MHRSNKVEMITGLTNVKKVKELKEKQAEQEQYFFTEETIKRLVPLCTGKTACLCTPTVAEAASKEGKDVVLFDIDTRMDAFFGKDTFVIYDLHRGLHSDHQANADRLTPPYEYGFDTIIVDPPFSGVTPKRLAQNVNALLRWDVEGPTYAYVVYPKSGGQALEEAFNKVGMTGQLREDIPIDHVNTPRRYDVGKKEIVLFQFRRV